jgi:hypothetical protein
VAHRLSVGLLVGACALGAWGLMGDGSRAREAQLLVERHEQHLAEQGWELQLTEACGSLRPWHDGYGTCRSALERLGASRHRRWAARASLGGPAR